MALIYYYLRYTYHSPLESVILHSAKLGVNGRCPELTRVALHTARVYRHLLLFGVSGFECHTPTAWGDTYCTGLPPLPPLPVLPVLPPSPLSGCPPPSPLSGCPPPSPLSGCPPPSHTCADCPSHSFAMAAPPPHCASIPGSPRGQTTEHDPRGWARSTDRCGGREEGGRGCVGEAGSASASGWLLSLSFIAGFCPCSFYACLSLSGVWARFAGPHQACMHVLCRHGRVCWSTPGMHVCAV